MRNRITNDDPNVHLPWISHLHSHFVTYIQEKKYYIVKIRLRKYHELKYKKTKKLLNKNNNNYEAIIRNKCIMQEFCNGENVNFKIIYMCIYFM